MESYILNPTYHQLRMQPIGHNILRMKSHSLSSESSCNQNSPEYSQISIYTQQDNNDDWQNQTIKTIRSKKDTSSDDESSDAGENLENSQIKDVLNQVQDSDEELVDKREVCGVNVGDSEVDYEIATHRSKDIILESNSIDGHELVEGHDYEIVNVYTVNLDSDLMDSSSEDETENKVTEEIPSVNESYSTSSRNINSQEPGILICQEGRAVESTQFHLPKFTTREEHCFITDNAKPAKENIELNDEFDSQPETDTDDADVSINESDLEVLPNIQDLKEYLLDDITCTRFKHNKQSFPVLKSPMQNICMDIDDAKTCLNFENSNLDFSDLIFDNDKCNADSFNKSDGMPRMLSDDDVNSYLMTSNTHDKKIQQDEDNLSHQDKEIETPVNSGTTMIDMPSTKMTSTPKPSLLNFCIEKETVNKEINSDIKHQGIDYWLPEKQQSLPNLTRRPNVLKSDVSEVPCNDYEILNARHRTCKSKKVVYHLSSDEEAEPSISQNKTRKKNQVNESKNKTSKKPRLKHFVQSNCRKNLSPPHGELNSIKDKIDNSVMMKSAYESKDNCGPKTNASIKIIIKNRSQVVLSCDSKDFQKDKNVDKCKNIISEKKNNLRKRDKRIKYLDRNKVVKRVDTVLKINLYRNPKFCNPILMRDLSMVNSSDVRNQQSKMRNYHKKKMKPLIESKKQELEAMRATDKDIVTSKIPKVENSQVQVLTSDVETVKVVEKIQSEVLATDIASDKPHLPADYYKEAILVNARIVVNEKTHHKNGNFCTLNKQEVQVPQILQSKIEKRPYDAERNKCIETAIKKEEQPQKKKKLSLQEYRLRTGICSSQASSAAIFADMSSPVLDKAVKCTITQQPPCESPMKKEVPVPQVLQLTVEKRPYDVERNKCIEAAVKTEEQPQQKKKLSLLEYPLRRGIDSAQASSETIFPDMPSPVLDKAVTYPIARNPPYEFFNTDKAKSEQNFIDPIKEAARKILIKSKKQKADAIRKGYEDLVNSKITKVEHLQLQPLMSDEDMMKIVGNTKTEVLKVPIASGELQVTADYERIILVSVGVNTIENVFEKPAIMNDMKNAMYSPVDAKSQSNFKFKKSSNVLNQNVYGNMKSDIRSPIGDEKYANIKIDKEVYKNITTSLKRVDGKISSNSLFASIQDVHMKQVCENVFKISDDRYLNSRYNDDNRDLKLRKTTIVREYDPEAEHGEDKVILHLSKFRNKPILSTILVQTDPTPAFNMPLVICPSKEISVNRKPNHSYMSSSGDGSFPRRKDAEPPEKNKQRESNEKVIKPKEVRVERIEREMKGKRSRSKDRYDSRYRRRSRSTSRGRRRRSQSRRRRSRSRGRYRRYRRSDSPYKRKRRSRSRSYNRRRSPSVRYDRVSKFGSRTPPLPINPDVMPSSKTPLWKTKHRPPSNCVEKAPALSTSPLRKPTTIDRPDLLVKYNDESAFYGPLSRCT